MLVISRSGLISILPMTLYFFLISVHLSDHSPADSTNEEENHALQITHNMHNISKTGIEIEKPKMTSLNEGNNNPGTHINMQTSLNEYSNTENATLQENQAANAILKKMQRKEIEEEYDNDINTNHKNWTESPKNKWLPVGIGVATWYEISLTGKKVQQTGEDGVEQGIYLQASTSKAVTLRKISEIGMLLVGIRMILF